jgi:exodeoxyribonuclease V alpha subunit
VNVSKINPSQLTILEGYLERIIYYNPENHYTIAKVKAKRHPSLVTIVGFMSGANPGEALKIQGQWETHVRYGHQFKIHAYEVMLPASVEGIQTYLESGLIKGLGTKMAQKIVQAFGVETFDVIENDPQRLLEVEGIGRAKAAIVCNAWRDHQSIKGLMQFMQEMGVNTSICGKIYQHFGQEALNILRHEPYRLAKDFSDQGFYIADTIAQNLGLDKDDPRRVKACVIHMVSLFAKEGHTFAEEENLLVRCENLFQIDRAALQNGIDELISSDTIVAEPFRNDTETRTIYLKDMYLAETGLANRLKALLSVPQEPLEINTGRISKEVEKKLAIKLSCEQLNILENVFSHHVAIITGGPGTGKTTLLRSISAIFDGSGKRVALAAPTGRAARRLSEVTRKKAQTIHRLLGYNFVDGRFLKNQDNPLNVDGIIIDEASMVDIFLMHHLLNAVPVTATLILVGDIFQLPSVGPGNVLSDMIHSARIPVFQLNEIFRQAQESSIIMNAHKVRQGEFPVIEPLNDISESSEFVFLECKHPNEAVSTIVKLCSQDIPERFGFNPIHDIQVLTPMHKGIIGTINLNQMLQNVLNQNSVMIQTMGNAFKIGDKVMHLKNNYEKEVYNGDIGIIDRIDKKKRTISVDYFGRIVNYDFDETDELTVAYAISVHKSQGSEYPAVIVPIMTQHYPLLQRNVLYTALTRGENLVVIIGTKKALTIALKNDMPQKRLSSLAFRLMEA